jgi:hypothetical protein
VWTVGFESVFSWRGGDFEIGCESSSTTWDVDCGEIQGTRIRNSLDNKEGRAVAEEDICEGARVDASATEFTIGQRQGSGGSRDTSYISLEPCFKKVLALNSLKVSVIVVAIGAF